jgi:hypothetical protein
MSVFLTLVCPSCGGKTSFAPGADRFVCDYCGNQHIFRLPAGPSPPQQAPRRLLSPRPTQVSVQKRSGEIEFTWRWFSLKYIPLAFFCIAWDSFLIFWYSMAIGSPETPWIFCVFPIAHVAVGVGLTYSTLAGFLNHSTLRLDARWLRVQHDPLPWYGERRLPVDELDQLYCKRHKASESTTYHLCARMKDGREVQLISNLDAPDVAAFLEQQIETWLDIPDQPVFDEALA